MQMCNVFAFLYLRNTKVYAKELDFCESWWGHKCPLQPTHQGICQEK